MLTRPGSGRLRQAVPGLSSHDDRLAQGKRPEQGQVRFQAPGQGAGAADDAVRAARDGPEGEGNHQTAIGAFMAGWAR